MIKIQLQLTERVVQLRSIKDIHKDSLLTEYISVYSATLVKINEAFQIRLLEAYEAESQWDCI